MIHDERAPGNVIRVLFPNLYTFITRGPGKSAR